MPATEDCKRCTEPCPQAARANEAAKGRMYATKEMIALLKKVESGQLAEVVRCVNCVHFGAEAVAFDAWTPYCLKHRMAVFPDDFCSYGERKDGDG